MQQGWTVLTALPMESRAIERICRVTPLIIGPGAIRFNEEMMDESTGIILAGIAGALGPNLKIGDVMIEAAGKHGWPAFPFQTSKIYCADHVIATPEEKAALFSETGAMAVDMESAIVRKSAEQRGIPMLHVRAISDQADHAIPLEIFGWLDPKGNPRGAAVALGLAKNPMLLPTLLRLRQHSAIACRSLALAVADCLAALT